MKKGKLNVFQKTMLRWSEVHPYNAVHVVKIPQPIEMPKLTSILNSHLEGYGLTNLVVDRKHNRFHYDGGPADIKIAFIAEQKGSSDALRSEIEHQLNTPFHMAAPIVPFRFFAMSEGESFYLGIVYIHFISSAESIVLLLKGIVNSFMENAGPSLCGPLNLYPTGYSSLAQTTLRIMPKWFAAIPSIITVVRQSFRTHYADFSDYGNAFICFHVGPSQFSLLVRAAKRWQVTFNDLFLAILLKSVSPLAVGRMHSTRRKKLSIASIVNIRKDLDIDTVSTFGLFLAAFVVSHTVPEGIRLEDLVKDVHKQTDKIKRHKLYFHAFMKLRIASIMLPLLSRDRQRKFYAKYYPLWGGITNINLNALWPQTGQKSVMDYVRAVSTGPVTPCVFSFTTVNDTVNVGISYRDTVFSKRDVEMIISEFSKTIADLKG